MAKTNKDSCLLAPPVEGSNKPSLLYKEMANKIKDRSLLNYIYGYYLFSKVGEKLDSLGKTRNEQGQHSAKDVLEFLNVSGLINKSSNANLTNAKIFLGAVDSNGNTKYYTDVNEILKKCTDFNSGTRTENPGISDENITPFIAYVAKHMDKYQIMVDPRNADSIKKAAIMEEQIRLWETAKQAFKTGDRNIDIEEFSSDPLLSSLINPVNLMSFIEYLKTLPNNRSDISYKRDIYLLLKLHSNSLLIPRICTDLEKQFGKPFTIEDVADLIYRSFREPELLRETTNGEPDDIYINKHIHNLMLRALESSKKNINNLKINEISQQLENESELLKEESIDYKVTKQVDEYIEKYQIDKEVIDSNKKNIKSLKDAAAAAAITLSRKLHQLEHKEGVSEESKALSEDIQNILREIEQNRYFSGCVKFLESALENLQDIRDAFNSIATMQSSIGENTMDICRQKARILTEIKEHKGYYFDIVKALSKIDKLVSEEDIDDEHKNLIKEQSSKIFDIYEDIEFNIKAVYKQVLLDIMTEFHGDTLENGVAIANAIDMATEDCSIYDYLYSVGETSSVTMNSLGKVIRDAQDSRDAKMNEIRKRIEEAERALVKAGYNNSFMYDKNGYIISEYDWVEYKRQRNLAIKEFKDNGLKGVELKLAISKWELNNTVEIEVDAVSKRTERVPIYINTRPDNPYNHMNEVQRKYYKTMMQIKGEMGTLVPSYAQKQFLPPQKRRDFLDSIFNSDKKGVKKLKDIVNAFWKKFQEIWKDHEDSEYYARNGVIMGEDYGITLGDYDDTPLRQVPIFYVNNLKDQNELLRDFSGALQAWAGTCISYNTMESIRELVEVISDEIKGIPKVALNNTDDPMVEVVGNKKVTVFRRLWDWSRGSKAENLLDSFISKHIYMEKTAERKNILTPVVRTLLQYVSIKNLAINIKGATANRLVGMLNNIMESVSGAFFNPIDLIVAEGLLIGSNTVKAGTKMMDFLTHNRNSKEVLLANLFDPGSSNFKDASYKRYYSNKAQQLMDIASDSMLALYSIGEYFNYRIVMFAVLNHEKVILDGNEIPLWKAYEVVKENGETSSRLVLKAGVTKLDGSDVDDSYIHEVRKKIRFANKQCHGAMNEEDKGIIHQYILGKLVMQFKQWMVGFYSKRYRGSHWDSDLEINIEGYYVTMAKLLASLTKLQLGAAIKEEGLTEFQKDNIKRFCAEMGILIGLTVLNTALGSPEDYEKDKYWQRRFLYFVKRMLADVRMGNPVGMLSNLIGMYKNLIPAATTMIDFTYIITGLDDYGDELQSGPEQGQDKYLRNLKHKIIPFYKQIERWNELDRSNDPYKAFDSFNKQ